jgi:hypothetical protein
MFNITSQQGNANQTPIRMAVSKKIKDSKGMDMVKMNSYTLLWQFKLPPINLITELPINLIIESSMEVTQKSQKQTGDVIL